MDSSGSIASLPPPPALQAPFDAPAPGRPLPSAHFYSVECPGYVKLSSVPIAVERLGGQQRVENAFKRTSTSKTESLLELSLRPGNPFAHPIAGDVVSTSNILLKVVKRKRKRTEGQGQAGGGVVGDYTVEALGMIPKTARFRSTYRLPASTPLRAFICARILGMVDYQYQPDMNDPIAKLRSAMDNMDGEHLFCNTFYTHTQ